MPPKTEKKTKEKIMAAAMASTRAKKKKWGKGKARDKARNAVFFDEALLTKMKTEIPKVKLITPYTVAERLKITLSLARAAIKDLEDESLVKRISENEGSKIYTRAQ